MYDIELIEHRRERARDTYPPQTREERIKDLADSYMTANTAGVIDDLFAWVVETCDPVELYREAQAHPSSTIGLMYQLAAMKMAENAEA